MATLAHGYAAPTIYGGLGRMALERAASMAAGLVREWRLRRDFLAISELSDSALSDIGIGRGFEEEAVRHGRGRRTRTVLQASPVAPLMGLGWTEWR